ncbi:L,D-transpeptidase [Litorivicinus sp.]|nr:L,D-transpeptidase [Litorivicinus sp.]
MAIESIEINLKTQNCRVFVADGVRDYACSTALNGPGEQEGSACTPRGCHRIRAIVGIGEPENAVFVARRPTGEVWTEELHDAYPNRDWILGRILWLCGNEPGVNRGGRVDSQRRFIYIHGTPPSEPMGVPMSHGCVRMRLKDICELADHVSPGTLVSIVET